MIKGKLLRGTLGLVIATFAMHVSADTSWNTTDNSVTYSVFQDNFALGLDNNGDNLTKSVSLSKLDLAEVASREGGTAANFTLSSVVLSMNGTVYGTIKVTNTSGASVTPRYSIYGQSMLTYGLESTPDENYNATVLFGAIAPGVESTKDVNVLGSATPNTVTITQDLERFLGIGTIETIGAFPVFGTFISGAQ